ncbi:tyrosine-protein phosphatase [Lactobacillus sp. LC28-10]|uniref:Tyrosine-protein phosphatase n=1 Tax=Secundilactobacillus angelensis TaxID=2722706 RepID=A0ABX1KVU3_9LACO|nr:tyrosine-protein phosphatase [Secundilactobacillus angelensis]MCH5461721.1 tyrosine-protein phosphatase [Secundilactobacillus angelensis]NLR18017.1 tyrosine-protein phosphatase [Secundilactobacillus angelensis]
MQETNQRVLTMDHGYNFRELGGYPASNGQTVKWQRVIRTATLAYLSENDQQALVDYGVKYDIDFRSDGEVAEAPDRIPGNVLYRHLPVFPTDKTDASKTQAELDAELKARKKSGFDHMLDVYRDMIVEPQAHSAYQTFFAALLSNSGENNVLLFHCTAGKDRTGMGAAFFLSALGVPHKIIKQDYLLTNDILSPLIQNRLIKAKNEGVTGTMLDTIKAQMTVSSGYFDAAMTAIDKHYGSMPQFLNEALQLSTEDIADLKKLYLTH